MPEETAVPHPVHSWRTADTPISCAQLPQELMGVYLAEDAITNQRVSSH